MLLVKINENTARRFNLHPEAFYEVLSRDDESTLISFNGARIPIYNSDVVDERNLSETTHIREQKQIMRG